MKSLMMAILPDNFSTWCSNRYRH